MITGYQDDNELILSFSDLIMCRKMSQNGLYHFKQLIFSYTQLYSGGQRKSVVNRKTWYITRS